MNNMIKVSFSIDGHGTVVMNEENINNFYELLYRKFECEKQESERLQRLVEMRRKTVKGLNDDKLY